ncbi:uncharacterized protein LOC135923387 isoform X2 [Gordionus sp. m RMFG-2023]|uniref:uncharacterized protein LOC135923387 isoform X2 n=1 Tax=Gordionus sp. m RMFG-2023 TaxID=3053472 RepID=UPI0031FD8308
MSSYLTLTQIIERDTFINEKNSWVLIYSTAKRLNNYLKIANYLAPNFDYIKNYEILIDVNFGTVEIVSNQEQIVTEDNHEVWRTKIAQNNLILSQIELTGDQIDHLHEDILNLEKKMVSTLGLKILNALFHKETDIAQNSLPINLAYRPDPVDGPSMTTRAVKENDERDDVIKNIDSGNNYVYIPNCRNNNLVSEELINLLDAMILDQPHSESNSSSKQMKETRMICHDEGIESDTVSGKSDNPKENGDYITHKKTISNDSFTTSEKSYNSLTALSTSSDEESHNHTNDGDNNLKQKLVGNGASLDQREVPVEQNGGLSLKELLKKCTDRERSIYPFLNARQIEIKYENDCKMLAMGTDSALKANPIEKIFRSSNIDLKDITDQETSIPLKKFIPLDLNEKIEWENFLHSVNLRKISSPHSSNQEMTPSHDITTPSRYAAIHDFELNKTLYGNIMEELKFNLPALKKCPLTDNDNKKFSHQDAHSVLIDELRNTRPLLTPIPKSKDDHHSNSVKTRREDLNKHEKLMLDIRSGSKLRPVKTIDKTMPKIVIDKVFSNVSDEFGGYMTSNSFDGDSMYQTISLNIEDNEYSDETYLETKILTHQGIRVVRRKTTNNPRFSQQFNRRSSLFVYQRDKFSGNSSSSPYQIRNIANANTNTADIYNDLNIDKNPDIFLRMNTRLNPDMLSVQRSTSLRYNKNSAVRYDNATVGDINGIQNGHSDIKRMIYKNKNTEWNRPSFNGAKSRSNTIHLNFPEFCHIRKALYSARLESHFTSDPKLYRNLKLKKVCHDCKKALWSIFGQQGVVCSICTKILCTRCYEKIMITALHLSNISTKSLTPSELKDEKVQKCQNFFKTNYEIPENNYSVLNTPNMLKNHNSVDKPYNKDTTENVKDASPSVFLESHVKENRVPSFNSSFNSADSSSSNNYSSASCISNADKSTIIQKKSPCSNHKLNITEDDIFIPLNPIMVCEECMIILRRSYLLTKLAKK